MSVRAWIWVSAAGLLLFLAIVSTQGVGVDFDPSRQQVSEYVHTSVGALLPIGLFAWSLSLLTLAGLTLMAARDRDEAGRLAHIQSGALLGAAIGVAVLACFPTDRGVEAPGVIAHATTAGQVHDGASAFSAVCILVAALLGAVRRSGWLRVLTPALVAIGLISSVALLIAGDPVSGIRQRALVAVACLWQAAWLLALRLEETATSPRSSVDSRCSTS
jgi:hypothetical protein